MKLIVTSVLAIVFILVLNVASARAQAPVVDTVSGKLRGAVDGDVVAFKGIPFAAPPVGKLRWRAPQPPAAWDGIRDATQFGPACAQEPMPNEKSELSLELSEDCLYLNVWAPLERGETPLPVLFWIHGGGFVNGSAGNRSEDGAALAREHVIVVSANYRMGRFGFFAHPALTAENADGGRLGNYALLDQIAALEWMRDNIRNFGGDPDRVTIAGCSAGGLSVHCLMISPLALGLFAGAIVESGLGRVIPGWGFQFPKLKAESGRLSGESVGLAFAALHGVEGEGPEALAALRALPAADIVDGLNMASMGLKPFSGPITDGEVIPASVEEAYAAGAEAAVPLIVGGNDADGFYPFFGGTRDEIFALFGDLRSQAEALYDPDGSGGLRRAGVLADADVKFLEPARNLARLHSAHEHPTWEYRFACVPESLRGTRLGAWHASEVNFLFDTLELEPGLQQAPTENDARAASQFRAYWLAFARTGRPAPADLPAWPRFDAKSDVLLEFLPEGPAARQDPTRERLDFAEKVVKHRSETERQR